MYTVSWIDRVIRNAEDNIIWLVLDIADHTDSMEELKTKIRALLLRK